MRKQDVRFQRKRCVIWQPEELFLLEMFLMWNGKKPEERWLYENIRTLHQMMKNELGVQREKIAGSDLDPNIN